MKTEIPIKEITATLGDTMYSYESFLTNFEFFEYSLINNLITVSQRLTEYTQYNTYGISQSFNEEFFYNGPRNSQKAIITDPYHQSKNFEINDLTMIIVYENQHKYMFYGNDGELKYSVTSNVSRVSANYKHLGNSSNQIHISADYLYSDDNNNRVIISINPYNGEIIEHVINGPLLIDVSNNSVYSAHMRYAGSENYELMFQIYNMNLSTMSDIHSNIFFKTPYVSNVAFYHTHLELNALSNDVNHSVASNYETNTSFKYGDVVPEIVPSSKIYVFVVDDRNTGLGGDYVTFDLSTRVSVKSNIVVTYNPKYYVDALGVLQYYNDADADILTIETEVLFQTQYTMWIPFIIYNSVYLVSRNNVIAFKKYKDLDLGYDYTAKLEDITDQFNIDPLYRMINSRSAINIWNKYSNAFTKIPLHDRAGLSHSLNKKYRTLTAYHAEYFKTYNVEHLFTSDDILKINPVGSTQGFLSFANKIQKYAFTLDYLGSISKGQTKNYILLLKAKKSLASLKDGTIISVTKPDGSIVEWGYIPILIDANNYTMICHITIFGFGNISLETIPYTIEEYTTNNNLTYSIVS